MLPFYSKFIGGATKYQLLNTIKSSLLSKQIYPIIDLAKENSKTKQDVLLYSNTLKSTAEYLANNNIPYVCALKLSSFSPFKPYHMLTDIIQFLGEHKAEKILLDAESNDMHKEEKEIFSEILHLHAATAQPSFSPTHIYKTYQMYRKDALDTIKYDIDAISSTQQSNQYPLNIKLVRGAYMHQDRHTHLLFENKQQTDDSYNKAVQYIHEKITKEATNINLLIASHNNVSCALGMSLFDQHKKNIAFAQLLGMNDTLSKKCVQNGFKTYKYVPFGTLNETLPYLTRRLYENYDIIRHIL